MLYLKALFEEKHHYYPITIIKSIIVYGLSDVLLVSGAIFGESRDYKSVWLIVATTWFCKPTTIIVVIIILRNYSKNNIDQLLLQKNCNNLQRFDIDLITFQRS